MKILGLDHIQLAMHPGGEDRARLFYRDILGMTEILKSPALAARGGCWFASGAAQVYLGVEADFRHAQKAHPALLVEGLDEIFAKCKAVEIPSKPEVSIDGRRRFHAQDTFGNRIELVE